LEELNLISTMLDSDIKIDAIKEEMISRALSEKNHKLPLHSLQTYNISLKISVFPYLSPRPDNFKPL
jgi:hypothetical protein